MLNIKSFQTGLHVAYFNLKVKKHLSQLKHYFQIKVSPILLLYDLPTILLLQQS